MSRCEQPNSCSRTWRDDRCSDTRVGTRAIPPRRRSIARHRAVRRRARRQARSKQRVTRGLYSRDVIVGNGSLANRNDTINVQDAGALADGRRFTEPSEPPITFKLGAGTVIAGWDRGLSGVCVGGRRQLVIAPDLGYGARHTSVIPANSVLVFEFELMSVR